MFAADGVFDVSPRAAEALDRVVQRRQVHAVSRTRLQQAYDDAMSAATAGSTGACEFRIGR